jgi:hypothetical protein
VVLRYYKALDEGDIQLFDRAVDQTNPHWKRVQNEQFGLWAQYFTDIEARVTEVRRASSNFYTVKALLDLRLESGGAGRAYHEVTVRRVGAEWKLSEPTVRELGKRLKKVGEGVTVEYYEWDARQARKVLQLGERALKVASEVVDVRPRRNVRLQLVPAYAASPWDVAGESVGYYSTATPNTLYLRSPGSYGFGLYRHDESPYDELYGTTVHELTHLLGDRRVPISKLPDWLTEGLAEWTAGRGPTYEVARAIQEDDLWDVQALQNFSLLSDDVGLAYGQSYELVDYLIEERGLRGYWRLADRYARTERLEPAIRQALGMGWGEFERGWLRWLRDKYDLEDEG